VSRPDHPANRKIDQTAQKIRVILLGAKYIRKLWIWRQLLPPLYSQRSGRALSYQVVNVNCPAEAQAELHQHLSIYLSSTFAFFLALNTRPFVPVALSLPEVFSAVESVLFLDRLVPKNWPTRSSCLMSTARKLRFACECFLCSKISFLARPQNWHLARILPLRATKAISVRSSKSQRFPQSNSVA